MTASATIEAESPPSPADAPMRSPLRLALRRFFRNKLAVLGALIVLFMMAACFGTSPWAASIVPESIKSSADTGIRRYEYQLIDHVKVPPPWAAPAQEKLPPQNGAEQTSLPQNQLPAAYWMGTDTLGRDLRARFFLGGAISLSLGLCSAAIAVIIGTGVGLLAGYLGGRTDAILMRIVDVLYGLPYILLVILMRVALVPFFAGIVTGIFSAFYKLHLVSKANLPSEPTVAMWANFLVLLVGIGAVSWLTLARVVRGQVLSLRSQPFVEAARAMGFGWRRIMSRHILPNLVGTIVVYGTLTVPAAILSESFLSFLGLGVQVPLPSWGNLAADGLEALNPVVIRWWLITWPCLGLSLTLLGLNFLGDGLRDAADARAG